MADDDEHYSIHNNELWYKIERIRMDDLYCIPNVFQSIADETGAIPASCWRKLMAHPYTPTVIKQNLSAFMKSVVNVLKMGHFGASNQGLIQETLQYLHDRLLLEKNKKRVYNEVVSSVFLEFLVERYHQFLGIKDVFDDVIMSKEAVSLLEANLLVNMNNYTDAFVKSMLSLQSDQICSSLFLILCEGIKSKNKNKILLKMYVLISEQRHNASLQECLLNHLYTQRIYQIKEDEELGCIVSGSISKTLAVLEKEEFCAVAANVLPLNHKLVDMKLACSYCDDSLLAKFFDSFSKLGMLLQLFQEILSHFTLSISLGEKSRSRLEDISHDITELQMTNITEFLCKTLEGTIAEKSAPLTKKAKLDPDSALQSFVADCVVVVLSNTSHSLPVTDDGILGRMKQMIGSLPPLADSKIKLYFNKNVFIGNLSRDFFHQAECKTPKSATELELLISSLQYSEDITEDLNNILSYAKTYPQLVWDKLLYLYNHMHVEQMFELAKMSNLTENCISESFSRLKDFQSVIVVHILQQCLGEVKVSLTRDPLKDISLSEARELIAEDLNNRVTHNSSAEGSVSDILQQISLDSGYNRLTAASWTIFSRNSSNHIHLMRFCKSPPPHIPLPIFHGKLAGRALIKLLNLDSNTSRVTDDLIELYLRVGVPITSADFTEFIDFLSRELVRFSSIVYILTNTFSSYPSSSEGYREVLTKLKRKIDNIIFDEKEVLASFTLTNLVISSLNLSKVTESHPQSELLKDTIALLLKKSDLRLKEKMELSQAFLNSTNDKDSSVQITQVMLSILKSSTMERGAEKFTLESSNIHFINEVLRYLPDTAAERLLTNTVFNIDVVEEITAPHVPVSMVPKMITKLSKNQVMSSINNSSDGTLISACLLCIMHSNYPPHIFTWTMNKLLTAIASEKYSADTDMVANVVRSCELFSKQKEVAKHHAPYVLLSIFEAMSHSNSQFVKDLSPSVYPLFDVCLVQGFQFLQARLSASARQLFIQSQTFYKQNIKYQGKT